MATRLDAAASAAATTLAYTVGAASNRGLIVGVQTEGTQSGNFTCDYGGQTMQFLVQQTAGSGTTQQTVGLFWLNDAGIAAASGNVITPGNTGTPGDLTIHARSYQDCVQTTPTNTDSDTAEDATTPLANCDIVTSGADALVMSLGGMGNAGTAAWAAPMTEQTDLQDASSTGSFADDEVPSATTIACELTWTTPNRSAIVAVGVEHAGGAANPSITDFGDEEHDDLETGVVITGADFGANQLTGFVEISDNATYATGTKVGQNETSWGDTSITVTIDMGGLTPGNPRWLWVTNDNGDRNTVGFQFHLHRARQFEMVGSANITAGGGQNTTAQLTLPATKAGGDFDGGKITDDTNPSGTVDPTDGGFIEDEICLQATTNSDFSSQSQFRVLRGGVVLDTYTVDPRVTISAAAAPQEVLHNPKLENSILLGHLHR